MYSNLQQPKADFSSQGPVFPLSWRAELELNIQKNAKMVVTQQLHP